MKKTGYRGQVTGVRGQVAGLVIFFACSLSPVPCPLVYAQSQANAADERFLILINDYKAKIKELLDKINLMQEKQNKAVQERDELKKEIAQLQKMRQLEQSQLNSLEQARGKIIQEKLNLEKQNQDLSIQLNQGREQGDNQIKQYQDEIFQLKKAKEANKSQSSDLLQQNNWLKDQYVKDRQAVIELKEHQALLEKEKEVLADSLAQAEKIAGGLKIERESLFKQAQEQSLQIKDDQAKLANKEELEKQLQAQKDELIQVKEKYRLLDQRYSLTLGESKASEQKIKVLSQQLGKAEGENQRISKEMESLQEIKEKKESASARLSKMIQQNKALLKENGLLHYNLGVFYTQSQNYKRAIVEFEKVLRANPNDSEAHYNLGVIYAEYLVDQSRAIEHFKRYLNIAPGDPESDRARKYISAREVYLQELKK